MKKASIASKNLMWQYYLSYLAVMLTVMALLLVYAYDSFYRFHTQILISNYTNSLNLIRETNENELSRLVSMTGQFTSSPNISPFVFKDEPEKAMRLTKQLAVYTGTSDFIRGLYLMFYGDEYVFSSTSSYLLENFVNTAAVFDGMSKGALVDHLNGTRQLTVVPEQDVNGYLFNTQEVSKRVLPVFVPVVYSSGVRCGTALYLIEKQTYLDMFRSIALDQSDVYILQEDEVLVSQRVSGVPREKVLDTANASDMESVRLHHEGKAYHLIELPGKTMRYRYILLVSDEEMQVAMAGTMQVLVVVVALVSALGLLLITRFVQSRIKPIRLLHGMLLNQKPTGNELLEIRDSVQKLIDDNAALSTKMENAEAHKKADFAHRFLKGTFESEDEWLSMAEDIRVNVDMRYFVVAIVAKPLDAEYELTADKLNRLFDETVSGVARTLGLYDKMALIAFANEQEALFVWLEGKFLGMRACCAGMTMAISAAHSDYQEGPRAYLEAENAFESRFVRGNASVIRFDAHWEARAGSAGGHQQVIERLRLALKAGDAARVRSALDDIAKVMRSMQLSLFGFRCMYNDILSVIVSEVQEGRWEQDIYDIFSLSQCLSLDDLDAMLYSACSRLIAGREITQPRGEVPEAIEKAMQMIRKHFSEPGLSVASIAQSLDMSDSKLSVEFRKACQMTPLEYLTMHRMRCACRLLHTTDMPVKDIALECGYYEISGFNRRFKAYTGMTPLQYRQRREEKEEDHDGKLSDDEGHKD